MPSPAASRRLIAPGTRKLRTVSSRAVALWHARAYDGKLAALLDLSGNGLHARLGSAVGADSNDPLRLQFSGEKYVYHPAVSGNYPATPSASANKITGDIFIARRVALADYTPAAEATIFSKYGGAGAKSYALNIDTSGQPKLYISTTGSNDVAAAATAALPVSDGQAVWIAATRRQSDGQTRYYYAPDSRAVPNSWTKLGDDVTIAAGSAIFDSTTSVSLIGTSSGTAGLWTGRDSYAFVRNGYDGAGDVVLSFDASQLSEPYASWTNPTTGEIWTLNRSTSGRKLTVVDRDLLLLGTDDYLEVADHPLLNFGTTDSMTMVMLKRDYLTPASFARYLSKRSAGGTVQGWDLSSSNTGTLVSAVALGDGVNQDFQQTSAFSPGVLSLIGGGIKGNTMFRLNTDGTITSATRTTGNLKNTAMLRIGAAANAVPGGFGEFEFIAAAIFREALSAADLTRLRGELLT
jgi:hypothetical protein